MTDSKNLPDPFDCQEFHELCMNYRGASYNTGNGHGPAWHYKQLQDYCRLAALAAQPSESRTANRLSSLLARIHRDGGHYEGQHGESKATEDAEAKVIAWLQRDDRAAQPSAAPEPDNKVCTDCRVPVGSDKCVHWLRLPEPTMPEARAALATPPAKPSEQPEAAARRSFAAWVKEQPMPINTRMRDDGRYAVPEVEKVWQDHLRAAAEQPATGALTDEQVWREAAAELRQMTRFNFNILKIRDAAKMLEDAYVATRQAGTGDEVESLRRGVAGSKGMWRSCSGCHELNEGHPTGPHSTIFGCAMGNGCDECGGIGVVWTSDDEFQGMADAMLTPADGADIRGLAKEEGQ